MSRGRTRSVFRCTAPPHCRRITTARMELVACSCSCSCRRWLRRSGPVADISSAHFAEKSPIYRKRRKILSKFLQLVRARCLRDDRARCFRQPCSVHGLVLQIGLGSLICIGSTRSLGKIRMLHLIRLFFVWYMWYPAPMRLRSYIQERSLQIRTAESY